MLLFRYDGDAGFRRESNQLGSSFSETSLAVVAMYFAL